MKVNWYFYKISWSWYEEYEPFEYASENEYTNKQLEQIILDAMMKGIKKLLKDNDSWIGNRDLIQTALKHLPKDFVPIKYQAEYNLWGSGIIREDDTEYTDKLPDKLKELIYKHNQKVHDEVFKGFKV